MYFIELDPNKYKFYTDVGLNWNYSDKKIYLNPLLIESIIDEEMWGIKEPFRTCICSPSGAKYYICFNSSFERNKFTKDVKNTINSVYKHINKGES